MSTTDRCALKLTLSPGQAGDAPQGRALRRAHGPLPFQAALCAWTAPTRETKRANSRWHCLGFAPVVPPNHNRVEPWEYDRVAYRRRNEVQRLFRRVKGYRRVFTRSDKLDVMFLAFVHLALIFDVLR